MPWRQLDKDHYGFFMADVMGHGLAAALYTIHLGSLWDRYCHLLKTPSAFAGRIGNELNRIVKGGESFATGICGTVEVDRRIVVFAGAGNPHACSSTPMVNSSRWIVRGCRLA